MIVKPTPQNHLPTTKIQTYLLVAIKALLIVVAFNAAGLLFWLFRAWIYSFTDNTAGSAFSFMYFIMAPVIFVMSIVPALRYLQIWRTLSSAQDKAIVQASILTIALLIMLVLIGL